MTGRCTFNDFDVGAAPEEILRGTRSPLQGLSDQSEGTAVTLNVGESDCVVEGSVEDTHTPLQLTIFPRQGNTDCKSPVSRKLDLYCQ